MDRLLSLLGIPALIFIGWLVLSTDRRHFPWRVVLWGVGLQIGFAMLILWTPGGRAVFAFLGDITTKFLSYSNAGAEFLFGNIVKEEYQQTFGFQFAFAILPTIIFVGAVMSIGYHLGILQRIVKGVAWVMTRTMGTSGAESLSNAVNIFVGQTEAPLHPSVLEIADKKRTQRGHGGRLRGHCRGRDGGLYSHWHTRQASARGLRDVRSRLRLSLRRSPCPSARSRSPRVRSRCRRSPGLPTSSTPPPTAPATG